MDCRECESFKKCHSKLEIKPQISLRLHYFLSGCSGYKFLGYQSKGGNNNE